MPRVARPRWHAGHACWYACIGKADARGKATEVYAPKSIAERDEAAAWKWFEAEKAKREAEVQTADPSTLSVRGICEHYLGWAEGRLNDGRLSAGHFTSKKYHLGLLIDEMGSRTASALTLDEINQFVCALQRSYSANYVANICASISAAFNWAVGRHLEVNPIKGFEAPTVPRSPERFAERVEAAAFLRYWLRRSDRKTVAGRFDRLTLLLERCLIRTGARPGELCNLWWSDIRWSAGVTTAGHTFAKASIPPERHKTGAKTGKPRTIYLTPTLTRALRRAQEQAFHPRSVFVHGRGQGGAGASEPWESGSRLSAKIRTVRKEMIARQEEIRERLSAGKKVKTWEARLAAVAISDQGHNRLTNYRWRHTAISTLLMLGVDTPTVAELTGTSPDMILRIYGHLLDRHLQAAAEKLVRPHPRPAVGGDARPSIG